MEVSRVFEETVRAYNRGYRVIANRGGTRSGKTYSVMQFLILKALRRVVTIDVVSESVPHLRRGAIKDLESIVDDLGLVEGVQYERNRTAGTFSFRVSGAEPGKRSVIRFFSGDDWGKIKGSRRQILFVNECNRLPYEVFRQLDVRTTETIFLDWNPDAEFWFELEGIKTRSTTAPEIVSTYKDNLAHLSSAQVSAIEANRGDENWWRVYGLGEIGKKQGLVYSDWEVCKEMPVEYKWRALGLDFGFKNPTAIVDVCYSGGDIWVDEVVYECGLTNDKVAGYLLDSRYRGLEVYCDSAEPKSINDLVNCGILAKGADKGGDSVRYGIDILQRYKLHVTDRSLDVLDELRHYCYAEDSLGNLTGVPVKRYDHSMDALRYVALAMLGERKSAKGMRGLRWV